jgi:hypothetical protein
MVDPNINPLKQWDPTELVFLIIIDTNVGVVSPWPWESSFNAQGLRVIIVVVQVGAVKISYVVVGAFRKEES